MKTDKTTKIKQAVFQLVQTEGLTNLSMSKIAKLAGIVPSNIYVYYASKTDLLSSIYRETKMSLDKDFQVAFDSSTNLEERITLGLRVIAQQATTHRDEYGFMLAVDQNMEVIDEDTRKLTTQLAAPITSMLEEIVASDLFKPVTVAQVEAYTYTPILFLASTKSTNFTESETNLIIQMCLDALRA